MDNPQDVTFFDFHLVDPKDAPFATFRFHYRSWANLEQLSLIPDDDPSLIESSDTSKAGKDLKPVPADGGNRNLEQESNVSIQLVAVRPHPDESVFDDSTSGGELDTSTARRAGPRRNGSFVLRTPPELRPQSATSQKLPQPSKTLRDALPPGFPESYFQRPLPDRPLPELPTDRPNNSWVPRSRKSSTASAAPSVAPSLLSYVKNESYLDETVEYGQAQEILMDKDHPGVPLNQENSNKSKRLTPPPIDTSMSDYENSFVVEDEPKDNDSNLLSPGNYMACTGSMLEKHIDRLENSQGSPCMRAGRSRGNNSPRSKNASGINGELNLDFSKFPHLQLSESEWIRRTPSPRAVPRRLLSPRLGRLWNTLRRNKSRSPLRSFQTETAPRNYSTPHLASPEVKERHGNWI